jgi:hypothetical protein
VTALDAPPADLRDQQLHALAAANTRLAATIRAMTTEQTGLRAELAALREQLAAALHPGVA